MHDTSEKYASDIRKATGLRTMAVGHILDPNQAEAILAEGHADLTAIGRQAMYDPYWPHHAAQALGADPDFKEWNDQAGWWLAIRRRGLEKVGFGPDGRPLSIPDEAALV
jgi:2,4-dienoyl-CoA reductase-like NADH-dependent reductase (Old Yellow Enzyme family)